MNRSRHYYFSSWPYCICICRRIFGHTLFWGPILSINKPLTTSFLPRRTPSTWCSLWKWHQMFTPAQTSTTCRSVFIISGLTDQRSTCKLSRALLPKECSGIQINKTLKKTTHLAPHMLLRVHCDVAAYSQKYVCFVTILMCMTPMTGWNNYAKYKAKWTRLRNCEVAWPKSEVTLPKYTILLQRTNVTDKGMESTNL